MYDVWEPLLAQVIPKSTKTAKHARPSFVSELLAMLLCKIKDRTSVFVACAGSLSVTYPEALGIGLCPYYSFHASPTHQESDLGTSESAL